MARVHFKWYVHSIASILTSGLLIFFAYLLQTTYPALLFLSLTFNKTSKITVRIIAVFTAILSEYDKGFSILFLRLIWTVSKIDLSVRAFLSIALLDNFERKQRMHP
jgi:hypothetical protein